MASHDSWTNAAASCAPGDTPIYPVCVGDVTVDGGAPCVVQCMPPPATPAIALCHIPTPSDSIDYFPPATVGTTNNRRLQGGSGLGGGDDDTPPGVGVANGDICAIPTHTLGTYSTVGQGDGGTSTTATLLNLPTLGMDLGIPPLFLPMPAIALTITGTIRTKVVHHHHHHHPNITTLSHHYKPQLQTVIINHHYKSSSPSTSTKSQP